MMEGAKVSVHLFSSLLCYLPLALIRRAIFERVRACALVQAVLSATARCIAGEEQSKQPRGGQGAAAEGADSEGGLLRVGAARVRVGGGGGVVEGT